MIPITKIDAQFNIYKKNKVILWGCGDIGKQMLEMLEFFDIDVYAFCDNNEALWGTTIASSKENKLQIPVISPDELKQMVENQEDIVVQIAIHTNNMNRTEYKDKDLVQQLKNLGVKNYISHPESEQILWWHRRNLFDKSAGNITLTKEEFRTFNRSRTNNVYKNYLLRYMDTKQINLICVPPKTGSFTLVNTLHKHEIHFAQLWGRANLFDKNALIEQSTTIKFITAVRDPIAFLISFLYQAISFVDHAYYRWDCIRDIDTSIQENFDAQKILDLILEDAQKDDLMFIESNIANFIQNFCNHIVDIKKYPFDKEKGYSIIKEGNIEVFVYQLEKLDSLISEISSFLGHDIPEWEKSNRSSEKWITDSYQQAKKELKFTEEYLDSLYDSTYTKHFYSEEDIKKYKEKWQHTIR